MVAREEQQKAMRRLLKLQRSSFLAVTGRRRVGKTYLIDEVYTKHIAFAVTGIQNGSLNTQLFNFVQKIAEYADFPIVTPARNWQEAFLLLKKYIERLPKNKKQVLFFDELPWMSTPKSGFVQLLAHLWNDYLSKQKNFILVICGSASSWLQEKIVNDKGGFHNRVTDIIRLLPFTLSETKKFFEGRKMKLTNQALVELYMVMGGIPYYLQDVRKGESPTVAINRMCFMQDGILKNEYDNLYKALFDNAHKHESIVAALANSVQGLTRQEIIQKSKIAAGGPYTRTMDELMQSGFVTEEIPYGKRKRGSVYRLVDEYSVFYHKFIKSNRGKNPGIWKNLSNSQAYKIWSGYAFETICFKHIEQIKKSLQIQNVYTENYSYRFLGNKEMSGFQIDMIVDRQDKTINLCECKYYREKFVITKSYATHLNKRKEHFQRVSKTSKLVLNTMITSFGVKRNKYYEEAIDQELTLKDLLS